MTVGDSSFHGGQGNIYSGNRITVTVDHDRREAAYISRIKIKPLRIAGNPVTVSWLIVSGTIGFLGSIAGLYSVFGTSLQFVALLGAAIGVMLMGCGAALWRWRFLRVPPLFNLEVSQASELYLTQIGGRCPKCNGLLKLREIGPTNATVTVVRCIRNPDHRWKFDHTVLGEL